MRAIRQWKIGDAVIGERDQAKHLGILWSVSGSTIGHVSVMTTSARSAFYAIQSVGPRFGLSYGLEVLSPTKTELLMLERCQLAILKSILGLPSRVSSLAVDIILGTLPMWFIAAQSKLSLLVRILCLSESSPLGVFCCFTYYIQSPDCGWRIFACPQLRSY